MSDFEQLKNSWKEQPIEGPSEQNFLELKKGTNKVAKKQRITNVVLLMTVVVLVVFFFNIGAMNFGDVALAIGVMITALLIRVLVEFFSIKYLNNLATTANVKEFKGKLKAYYKNRVIVHLALTPILLAVYSYAFWTLLPDFKVSLSEGFYTYVVYSSMVLLLFFVVFIGIEVRKELRVLNELKRN